MLLIQCTLLIHQQVWSLYCRSVLTPCWGEKAATMVLSEANDPNNKSNKGFEGNFKQLGDCWSLTCLDKSTRKPLLSKKEHYIIAYIWNPWLIWTNPKASGTMSSGQFIYKAPLNTNPFIISTLGLFFSCLMANRKAYNSSHSALDQMI